MPIHSKIEAVIQAASVNCRRCEHARERTVIMPTCARHQIVKIDRWHKVEVHISRFCYDVRLDELACGWRGRSFLKQKEHVTIFTGVKDGPDV